MSARSHHGPRALAATLLLTAVGCASETTVLIEVLHQDPNAQFSALHVRVFDAHGEAARKDVAPVSLPGALTLQKLPDRAQELRVVIAADGGTRALSAAAVTTIVHGRATAVVDLTTSIADSDDDGIPDPFDVCPAIADPGQASTHGGAPGDACGGMTLPDGGAANDASVELPDGLDDLALPMTDGTVMNNTSDLSTPVDLAGVLFIDDFTSGTLDTNLWAIDRGNGGTVTVSGGMLFVQAPATANAYAEVASRMSFPVGTTFTARINFGAGQTYDEKGVGFANARLSDGCAQGETEAALLRGFNDQLVIEPKTGNLSQCLGMPGEPKPYPGGFRIVKIVRLNAGQIDFYDDSKMTSDVARVPGGALPVRLGVFTSTANPPATAVSIAVDWVMVTSNN